MNRLTSTLLNYANQNQIKPVVVRNVNNFKPSPTIPQRLIQGCDDICLFTCISFGMNYFGKARCECLSPCAAV